MLGLPTTKALASPKSANFKRISLSIRRFWGLNFDGLTREIPMLQNRWAKGSRTWCLYEWFAWPQRSKKTWSFPILEKLSDVCSISQTARKLRCFSLILWIYVKIYGYNIYIYILYCMYTNIFHLGGYGVVWTAPSRIFLCKVATVSQEKIDSAASKASPRVGSVGRTLDGNQKSCDPPVDTEHISISHETHRVSYV